MVERQEWYPDMLKMMLSVIMEMEKHRHAIRVQNMEVRSKYACLYQIIGHCYIVQVA